LKNGKWRFGKKWRKKKHKRRSNKGGTEGGWGWLVNGSGYRGLITIGGIKKMYDIVCIRFNFNFDHEMSV
jgi:hypothetical protein